MPAPITEEVLKGLVEKYQKAFQARFPHLTLSVFRSLSGRPPVDDIPIKSLPTIPAALVSGLFLNADGDYRIGINKMYSFEGQLMTFFHEYGHAAYKAESEEAIDNEDALVRTETAALLSSLRLADDE